MVKATDSERLGPFLMPTTDFVALTNIAESLYLTLLFTGFGEK